MADNIVSDFGINLLEEEIDDVIFQTNEFLCDATFTGSQGPFWWLPQMPLPYTLQTLAFQPFTNSRLVRQSPHGTKTGQNRRKIKSVNAPCRMSGLLTLVLSAKVRFCPVTAKGFPLKPLSANKNGMPLVSRQVMQGDGGDGVKKRFMPIG